MTKKILQPRIARERAREHRLLVCLDRSPLSELALPYAAAWARASDSSIALVHVLESHGEPGEGLPIDAMDWEVQRAEACNYLNRIVAELECEEVQAEAMLLQGHPAEQIHSLCNRCQFDLVVLSSHGEKGITDWGLSSVAEKVIARARTSILVVPSSWAIARSQQEKRIQHVLALLDGSPRSEAILPQVQTLARREGSTIILAHILPALEECPLAPFSREDVEFVRQLQNRRARAAELYLNRLKASLKDDGYEVRVLVECGDPRLLLYTLIEREGIDLVAMTAHGVSGHRKWCYGGTSGHLIHHPAAPTLMVQNLPQASGQAPEFQHRSRNLAPVRPKDEARFHG